MIFHNLLKTIYVQNSFLLDFKFFKKIFKNVKKKLYLLNINIMLQLQIQIKIIKANKDHF